MKTEANQEKPKNNREEVLKMPKYCPEPCPCPQCANYRAMLEESIQDEICDAGFMLR